MSRQKQLLQRTLTYKNLDAQSIANTIRFFDEADDLSIGVLIKNDGYIEIYRTDYSQLYQLLQSQPVSREIAKKYDGRQLKAPVSFDFEGDEGDDVSHESKDDDEPTDFTHSIQTLWTFYLSIHPDDLSLAFEIVRDVLWDHVVRIAVVKPNANLVFDSNHHLQLGDCRRGMEIQFFPFPDVLLDKERNKKFHQTLIILIQSLIRNKIRQGFRPVMSKLLSPYLSCANCFHPTFLNRVVIQKEFGIKFKTLDALLNGMNSIDRQIEKISACIKEKFPAYNLNSLRYLLCTHTISHLFKRHIDFSQCMANPIEELSYPFDKIEVDENLRNHSQCWVDYPFPHLSLLSRYKNQLQSELDKINEGNQFQCCCFSSLTVVRINRQKIAFINEVIGNIQLLWSRAFHKSVKTKKIQTFMQAHFFATATYCADLNNYLVNTSTENKRLLKRKCFNNQLGQILNEIIRRCHQLAPQRVPGQIQAEDSVFRL